MTRVVLDTNVLVSALITNGKPRRLLLKLRKDHTVVISRKITAELADVLARDKFGVTEVQTEKFLLAILRKAKLVSPHSRFKVVPEDPDDNEILNVAYSGKADYVVTGDSHLLALKKFKRIPIVTVDEMLKILKNPQTEPNSL